MHNKTLGGELLLILMTLCITYGFIFPQELFRILLILYMPDTRIGIIVFFLGIYIVYIKKNKVINDLDSNKTYHIIFAISIALFINGMIKVLSEAWLVNIFDIPFLINKYEFLTWSLIITFIIFIPYIIFIYYSKISHSLSVLIVNALFGIISLFLTTIIGLKEINTYFDKSKPKIIEGIVEDKRIASSHSKSGYGKLYYVTYSGYEEREVPSSRYLEMDISNRVNVYIKEGYLGAKWVSNIEKIK